MDSKEYGWSNQDKKSVVKKQSSNKIWWWLIGTLIVAVILIGGGVDFYFYYQNSLVSQGVGIEFSGNSQVNLGQPFSVTVNYFNNTNYVLKDSVMSLSLPDGVESVDSPQDRVLSKSIGDLSPGGVSKINYTLIALKNPGSVQTLTASFSYGLFSGSSSRFQKNSTYNINVLGPAVSLTFNSPTNITSGQNFDLVVTYQNNTATTMKNLSLNLTYPSNFTFVKSSVKPSSSNNVWLIDFLNPGDTQQITITGFVVGQSQTFFDISASINSNINGQNYALNTQDMKFLITSSPLSVSVNLNNNPNYIASLSDNLNYTISYQNNSQTVLKDAIVTVTLSGEMFNFSTLKTSGSYNGLTQTLSWNASNDPNLAAISPGSGGSESFSINVKSYYPIVKMSDKNFVLRVKAQVQSPTQIPGSNLSNTTGATEYDTDVMGAVSIAAKGYFYDPSSTIVNSGPFPPKVNQTTEYTIHWIITNYSTDISNVSVEASLGVNVSCGKIISSTVSSQPVCNQQNGTVTWNIDKIPATAGIVLNPVEAIFQVQATPAQIQVNAPMTLLGPTQITATDDFTGLTLQSSAKEVNTLLEYDKRANQQGIVTQ